MAGKSVFANENAISQETAEQWVSKGNYASTLASFCKLLSSVRRRQALIHSRASLASVASSCGSAVAA